MYEALGPPHAHRKDTKEHPSRTSKDTKEHRHAYPHGKDKNKSLKYTNIPKHYGFPDADRSFIVGNYLTLESHTTPP